MTSTPGATTPAKEAERRDELAAVRLSLAVGVALLMLKFIAYALTGSSAIFSDALESIINVIAAIMAMVALRVSHSPADFEHPYGHGKAEFLSAAVEGGMIMLAAPAIVGQSVVNIFHHEIARVEAGAVLTLVSLVVNAIAGILLIKRARRGPSIALEADGKHLLADALTSAAVLVALVLIWLTHLYWIDSLCALAVAAYLAFLAWGIMRRSMAGLMDEQDLADDATIRGILDRHIGPDATDPRVCAYHKLRHRHSGRYHWVDFHLIVPATWNIAAGHRVASRIEKEIESSLGEADATTHVEPCDVPNCANCSQQPQPEPALQP